MSGIWSPSQSLTLTSPTVTTLIQVPRRRCLGYGLRHSPLHSLHLLLLPPYRYLDDGVWDMVSVKVSRKLSKYSCCPAPFAELYYHLIFKRRSEFYVIYLICPCMFLSMLSLLVFYLPPECGEKLTLSITNLLALVVFQQVIAETMPPSGDGSPIVGMYTL